jgi:hypothetical protein
MGGGIRACAGPVDEADFAVRQRARTEQTCDALDRAAVTVVERAVACVGPDDQRAARAAMRLIVETIGQRERLHHAVHTERANAVLRS